jgi:hypothetical protein
MNLIFQVICSLCETEQEVSLDFLNYLGIVSKFIA